MIDHYKQLRLLQYIGEGYETKITTFIKDKGPKLQRSLRTRVPKEKGIKGQSPYRIKVLNE